MKFSGFINTYGLDDNSWEYRYGDKTHNADTLKDLEFLVRMHGLKWGVLDKDLAQKSLDEDKLNYTGFLNVYIKDDLWCYRKSNLKSHSLEVLKKRVLSQGLEWRIVDEDLAYKNMKLDSRKFKK